MSGFWYIWKLYNGLPNGPKRFIGKVGTFLPQRTGEMAQSVKRLLRRPEKLRSTPGTYLEKNPEVVV